MTLELHVRRARFARTYTVDLRGEFESSPLILTRFCDRFLGRLPDSYLQDGAVLSDLKGREPRASIDDSFPVGTDGFELFAIKGTVGTNESSDVGLSARITTEFKAFRGAHHIEHRVHVYHHGALPGWVSPRLIPRLLPVTLTSLRFGFDRYKSSYFGSMLGFTPETTQELLIEADTNRFSFRIRAERLLERSEIPFADGDTAGIFVALTDACNACWGIDLPGEYADRSR